MKYLHRIAPNLRKALRLRGFLAAIVAVSVVPAQADLAGALLALAPSLDAHVAWLALLVAAVMAVLGWDIAQINRELRSMRTSFQRSANSRSFRDGGRA